MARLVDLSSAYAKRDHAARHLATLVDFMDGVMSDPTRLATLGARFDRSTDRHAVYLASVPDMDDVLIRLSLGVGDVVHNLRSALDHAAWQLACLHAGGGVPPDPTKVKFRLCFPTDSCRKRAPAFLSDGDWALVHEWQACKGTNGRPDGWSGEYVHQLDLLARLNNDDKHKVLTALTLQASQFEHFGTRMTPHPGWIETPAGAEFLLERALDPDPEDDQIEFSMDFKYGVGTSLLTLYAPAWPKSDMDFVGTAKPTLALADGGRHAVSTLERLHLYVGQVLDVIADSHDVAAAPG